MIPSGSLTRVGLAKYRVPASNPRTESFLSLRSGRFQPSSPIVILSDFCSRVSRQTATAGFRVVVLRRISRSNSLPGAQMILTSRENGYEFSMRLTNYRNFFGRSLTDALLKNSRYEYVAESSLQRTKMETKFMQRSALPTTDFSTSDNDFPVRTS